MRKLFLLMSFLITLLLFTSCNINDKNNNNTLNNSSSNQFSVSEKDAIEIITKKIGDDNGERIIESNGLTTINDINYYTIHAYSVSKVPLDEDGTRMTYTYGWYYVDTTSGKSFEAFLSNPQNLIPLDKITFVDESRSEYANSSEYSTKLLIKSLGLKDTDPTSYNGLIKRDNNFYFLMNALPSDSDLGIWEFYTIDKNTNEVYKWDVKNDIIILIE